MHPMINTYANEPNTLCEIVEVGFGSIWSQYASNRGLHRR